MTASTPSQSTPDPQTTSPPHEPPAPKSSAGLRSGARAALKKLLGRDRDKSKKDDPNIYPLF